MTGNDLFREIGNINEKYIAEAEMTKRSVVMSPVFRRTLATAACLVLCLGVYFSVKQPDFTTKNESATISADQAGTSVNTESVVMDSAMNESVTASGSTATNTETEGSFWEDIFSEGNATQAMPEADKEVYTEATESDSVITQDTTDLKEESTVQESMPIDVAVVDAQGCLQSGLEEVNTFLTEVEDGKVTTLEMVVYSKEGESVFYYIHYNGTDYYVMKDYSRDTFADAPVEEYTYKYLKILEETSAEDSGYDVIVLTNYEDVTLEAVKSGVDETACLLKYVKE